MYFAKFPAIVARVGGEPRLITDIFTRVVVAEKFAKYHSFLLPYTVKDGEMIEHVAYKFYGDANYHWVLFLVNKITNLYEDWPMSEADLEKYINEQYENPNDIRHYILPNGVIISEDGFNLYEASAVTPVTFKEHETTLNDAKREIKVLDPQYLNEFENNLISELQ